jgi:hypothetical protein
VLAGKLVASRQLLPPTPAPDDLAGLREQMRRLLAGVIWFETRWVV